MRRKVALTIVCLACSETVFAQTRGGDFQLTKITRDVITTPDYTYTGAGNLHPNRERWLQVEVEFAAAPQFTEELTFKYYILLAGKLLTGEVTHVNILPGRELRSVVYLPPRALAHFLGNRALTINSVENIAVQLLAQGAVKDELSLVRARPQWFSGLPQVSGFLLNKNETPFAPLYWDRYEQIKSH